ncbi:MAG TPA: tRNA pseudouridine(55) synthase TruB [Candidatus Akkermansia intestinigallinarum]|uniref:tRNA pseudouridine synthase B n=1 Tax=Candidatus Akkermansia intestinigallinarum TaxID=2838431 RepID=A0A9D1VBM1_9BACT|nr:tRNA pseudouridine(55) synthase TruB [Candidatus Akkermansia intestinigallinarum]
MSTSEAPDAPCGVLLVDKDPGFTSHNAVALCRRVLNTRKVGHCGTLDPMATGLLMVVIGKATKLQDRLMCDDKEYLATMKLGIETNSQDADGQIIATRPTDHLSADAIRAAFEHYSGSFDQTPPMYSAVKINGVPCYKLARKGQSIERQARHVTVREHDILRIDLASAEVDFRVRCSKGFYVRTYAHDIGQLLGCGAHLTALRRSRSGPFRVEEAISVPALKACTRDELLARLLSIEQVLSRREN